MVASLKRSPGEVLAEMLSAKPAMPANPSVEQMASDMQALGPMMPPAPDVSCEAKSLRGIDGLWFTPSHPRFADRVILYLHGGGYSIGSAETHLGFASTVSSLTGTALWSIDYRLAGAAPFPAAIQDCYEAYLGLLESGFKTSQIAVFGDSAGGGAALALALMAIDKGVEVPAALVLYSPWTDLTLSGETIKTMQERDPIVSTDSLVLMRDRYVSSDECASRYASPALSDLAGLPPIFVQVGSEEMLLSDSIMLAAAAGQAKVDVTLEVCPEMTHVFQAQYLYLDGSTEAIVRSSSWLETRMY